MRIFYLPMLLMALLLPSRAHADDVDRLFVCPLIDQQLAKKIADEIKGIGRCQAYCTGCGCKGGPGYRAANGQCVGFAQIISKCGPPPHAGCVRECAPVTENCVGHVLGRSWLKTFAANAGFDLTFLPPETLAGKGLTSEAMMGR